MSGRRLDDGTIETWFIAELYTLPLWRYVVGKWLYWFDLHKPRFLDPSGRGSQTVSTGPGTCRCKWRLRLELWLCYDFHQKGRTRIETVRIADRELENWHQLAYEPPLKSEERPA